jgi:hypothetical protein
MSGANKIDLGRTDCDQEGLIAFEDRLGATRRTLTYYRYTSPMVAKTAPISLGQSFGQVFSVLPDVVLSTAGGMLYRHMG